MPIVEQSTVKSYAAVKVSRHFIPTSLTVDSTVFKWVIAKDKTISSHRLIKFKWMWTDSCNLMRKSVLFTIKSIIMKLIASSRHSVNWLDMKRIIHTCGALMVIFFSLFSHCSVFVCLCRSVRACKCARITLTLSTSNAIRTFK